MELKRQQSLIYYLDLLLKVLGWKGWWYLTGELWARSQIVRLSGQYVSARLLNCLLCTPDSPVSELVTKRSSSKKLEGVTTPSIVFSSYGNGYYKFHLASTTNRGGGGGRVKGEAEFSTNKGKRAQNFSCSYDAKQSRWMINRLEL